MAVFKQRRGTAAALAAANEVPADGQIIYETDTNRMKVGNGVTSYTALPYLDSDVTIAEVTGLQAALDGKQPAGSYAALVHTHIKADVGLGNVDNTSDANKPVSTAQAADATAKADAAQAFAIQRANHTGTQAISTVVGLQTALDGKAASSHTHTIANVTGLQTALDGKQAAGSYAALVHVHAVADVTGLQAILDGKQPSGSYAAAVHTHAIADTTGLQAALDGKQPVGTYATLVGGTVPAAQLPSYVDDVLEYANTGAFPATGETGKIYVTTGDNRTYRWSGSTYVEISASPGSTDAVPEGSTNLYYTNVRAAAAAPVQSVAGRTGAIALAVADVSGAVSSSDSRLTDTRTPTDGSVTTAKLASSLVVDGNSLTLRFRRDTLANFTAANPTPALGELLYETDTNRVKVGDGATAYTTLAYLTTGGGGGGGASPPSTLLDSLTFNGSTTTFTLKSGGTNVTPTSAGNLIISLNGVIQQPGVSYTIAGSAITFSVAPAATDSFFGVLIGGNVPHASTHATGGSDALSPADIGASAVGHAHSALDVTSGTFDIARIPVGTSSTTVAAGNDARFTDARTPTDGSVTDAKITSGGLSASSLNWAAIAAWQPNTAYAKGDLVSNAGIAYRRSTAGTSGATFNVANWQQITPSEFVASQITSGTISTARLGSGTASSTTFLRGDGAWDSLTYVREPVSGGFLPANINLVDANVVSGLQAVVVGGEANTASGDQSYAFGYGAVSHNVSQMAHSASPFAAFGDAQAVRVIGRATTSSATARSISFDGSTTGSSRLPKLRTNTAMFLTVTIGAIMTNGSKGAHYVRKVAIKNVSGTVSLIGAVSTVGTDVEDDAAYDVSLTADSTNKCLNISVTGKTGETLRWFVLCDGVEIGWYT